MGGAGATKPAAATASAPTVTPDSRYPPDPLHAMCGCVRPGSTWYGLVQLSASRSATARRDAASAACASASGCALG
jgi:hypothetical protein